MLLFWLVFFLDIALFLLLLILVPFRDLAKFFLYYIIAVVVYAIVTIVLKIHNNNEWIKVFNKRLGVVNWYRISFTIIIFLVGAMTTRFVNPVITGLLTGCLMDCYLMVYCKDFLGFLESFKETFDKILLKKYRWLK